MTPGQPSGIVFTNSLKCKITMLKIILSLLLVVVIYSLYKYIARLSGSSTDKRSSNEGKAFDDRRAVEAEYQIVEEREQEEDG